MIAARSFLATALVLVAGLCAPSAWPQSYPERPIRLIIPFTPGSPNDVLARVVSQPMAENLGQPIVIEHRPGAGTTIGTKAVAQAEPDGYTLLFASSSQAISAALYANLGYDPIKSFAPVGLLATSPWILVIAPSIPAKTIAELVAHSKANPGKLNFGFGLGTAPQLIGESLKVIAGADIGSVPYKGGAQAVTDILGGTIHMNIGTPSTLLPLIRADKLRPIAVTSSARLPELPDVPTMAESGLPQLTLSFTAGILAPAGTPATVADRLNASIVACLKSEEVRTAFAKLDFTAAPMSRQEYAAFLAAEVTKWATMVKTSGAKVN
jgi:tripartite-type tricarboxylate transporter receptor subunit TctC